MTILKFIKNSWYFILIIFFLLITNVLSFSYSYFMDKPIIEEKDNYFEVETPNDEEVNDELLNVNKIRVDIKGYVNNPGVYELEDGAIVEDLITLAGGIKADGTTENINLSKKLTDEMVIVIYSKAEIKEKDKELPEENKDESVLNITDFVQNYLSVIDKNEPSPNAPDISESKININTASKEELMSLKGIGEAKALSIIEYRENNPFTCIEELKNISGIGEKVFEQIKDYITI